MECQNCGADLPADPQWALENGEIDEYASHVVNPDDSHAVAETWFYCDPGCLAEDKGAA